MDEIDSVEQKTEIRPFKCVVCNGFGTLQYGKIKCHACKGQGYILVPQKIKVDPNIV